MARKTKEEALQTRQIILDAAETLFQQQGVSRTSLQQIAQAANVTRGAIYWHFSDKLALFQALLDRATLSADEIFTRIEKQNDISPLNRILALISELTSLVNENSQIRNVLDIVFHKIELVDEFAVMSERHLRHLQRSLGTFTRLLLLANQAKEIHITEAQVHWAARGLQALSDGLFHNWRHDSESFDLREITLYSVKTYLQGLKHPSSSGQPAA